ncbi:MAG: hypothetical protein ACKO7P_00865 [Bacteroidota bacterium]
MDTHKLIERFSSKKFRPVTSIVIIEVMLFFFSIESLIEWFNIHPKLFFILFVSACLVVFSILYYIKQPEEGKSWIKALINFSVIIKTFISIIVLLFFFGIYVALLVPEYKVISISHFKKNQFAASELEQFKTKESLQKLSEEIKTLIGEQYCVKIDNNVKIGDEDSRMIIVPGIFDDEKAVETIMKLEERATFFYESDEENQIPTLAKLWHTLNPKEKKVKNMKHFVSLVNGSQEQIGFNKILNSFKYVVNINSFY